MRSRASSKSIYQLPITDIVQQTFILVLLGPDIGSYIYYQNYSVFHKSFSHRVVSGFKKLCSLHKTLEWKKWGSKIVSDEF